MERVLVTGATGFVGRALCKVLAKASYRVRAAVRGAGAAPLTVPKQVVVEDVNGATDWRV